MFTLMRTPGLTRSPLAELLELMDRPMPARSSLFTPASDVVDTEDALMVRLDVPGMTEADIAVEVRDGVLYISGERRRDQQDNATGFQRVERSYGRFSRHLRLPRGVDADAITASLEHGVLEVRVPKPEPAKPHRITIGAGEQAKPLAAGDEN